MIAKILYVKSDADVLTARALKFSKMPRSLEGTKFHKGEHHVSV